MSAYHEKKYTNALLVKMTGEQKLTLMERAKKAEVSAAEIIRRLIVSK